ncbi:ABC1 family protein [Klebsormidium nitens]|uniref:ABC1 family protein n=1 Tax=Klebsormidium nitens TaxID=105231 RepID=A0A1Y1IGB7_KLENI|nr:ABC1 family protein [Klebsormidium nitens]|eukprot:GAQ89122.1 ABC1 family protein [Klebsormidium nitens]
MNAAGPPSSRSRLLLRPRLWESLLPWIRAQAGACEEGLGAVAKVSPLLNGGEALWRRTPLLSTVGIESESLLSGSRWFKPPAFSISASTLCVSSQLDLILPSSWQIRSSYTATGSPGATVAATTSTTAHQAPKSTSRVTDAVRPPPGAAATTAPPAAAELLLEDGFFTEDETVELPQRLKPAVYDPGALARHYRWRPLPVLWRALVITAEVGWLRLRSLRESDINKRAEMLRLALIRLGPAFIKLGQTLSTRPDVLPPQICAELAKLQDQIPPFPTRAAFRAIEAQLGAPIEKLFQEISPEPVAAASLGQVYKARLPGPYGAWVAVKVQRPGLAVRLALDAYLLRQVAAQLQRYVGARGSLTAVVDEMVGRVFEEVDYVREAHNAERFAQLYAFDAAKGAEHARDYDGGWDGLMDAPPGRRRNGAEEGGVRVPRILWRMTTHQILTMEWMEGVKLTDAAAIAGLQLNAEKIVDFGVLCSLRQLLEEGFFHSDPHPGNLLVTSDGLLVYLDFGMMSELPHRYRIGLIRTLVHFVNRDALGLASDFVTLGFLPPQTELARVAAALRESFGTEGRRMKLDFQGIVTQLAEVMYRFQFQYPAVYTMVIRALGSLEGTATALDPSFKVLASAYPFVVGRLLADPTPEMREILRELLLHPDGNVRWHRLERLVAAIGMQGRPVTAPDGPWGGRAALGRAGSSLRGALDQRAIVAATADLLDFVMADSGTHVRHHVVQDLAGVTDSLVGSMLDHVRHWAGLGPAPDGRADAEEAHPEDARPAALRPRVDAAGHIVVATVADQQAAAAFEASSLPRWSARLMQPAAAEGGSGRAEERRMVDDDDDNEDDVLLERVAAGMRTLGNTVQAAPALWLPLLARMALRREMVGMGMQVGREMAASMRKQLVEAWEDTLDHRTRRPEK